MKNVIIYDGYTSLDRKAFLRMKIGVDLAWAKQALGLLMGQQVTWEVRNNTARGKNGAGPNKVDTPMFTRLWKMYQNQRTVFHDEEKRLMIKIQKYTGQLVELWPLDELDKAACAYYGITPHKKYFFPELPPFPQESTNVRL